METILALEKENFRFLIKRDFDEKNFDFLLFDDDFEFSIHNTVRYKNLQVRYWRSGTLKKPYISFDLRVDNCRLCNYKTLSRTVYYEFSDKEGNRINITPIYQTQKSFCEREVVEDKKEEKVEENSLSEKKQSFLLEKVKVEYKKYYEKIINKDFFYILLPETEEEFYDYFYVDYKKKVDLKSFIKRYIEWEQCGEYVRSNMNYSNLLQKFPDVATFLLPVGEINDIIDWEKEYYSAFDNDEQWLFNKPNKKIELEKELNKIYSKIFDRNNELKCLKLKEKYTVDFVKNSLSIEMNGIENILDMERFLKKLLENHSFSEEKELIKEIKSFFQKYKNHEKEYKELVSRWGTSYYLLEYSCEKEAKFYAGKYTEEEKEEAECFNQIISYLRSQFCIEGSTEILRSRKIFSSEVGYLKSFIQNLIETRVIIEENDGLKFNELNKLEEMDESLIDFEAWENSDKGEKYKQELFEKKARNREAKQKRLKEILLSDEKFYSCTNESLRLQYLKELIVNQYEQGEDNFFPCLEAYRHNKKGVCFQEGVAKLFLKEVWNDAKRKNKQLI